MEPGVPFALLGAVVLLQVAAWAGLGGAAVALAGRRPGTRTAAALVVLGAVVLSVAEVVTATQLGDVSSRTLPTVQTAGLLLLCAGLYAGALTRRAPDPGPRAPTAAPGVVVPLGAPVGAGLLVAAAAVAAALAALRSRRDAAAALVATGLALVAVAAVLATAADDDGRAALAVLLVRGAAALAVLAGLVLLARSSLLAKVVGAILAGVVVMAAAAVGVVGTTVERGYSEEQSSLVRDAAVGRRQLLAQRQASATVVARIAADACGQRPDLCGQALQTLTEPGARNFALEVPTGGTPRSLGGGAPLTAAEVAGVVGSRAVATAAAGGPGSVIGPDGIGGPVRLVGARPGLALVVAIPRARPTPSQPAPSVFVYGVRLDDKFVTEDVDAGGFGLTLFVGDQIVASNLTAAEQRDIAELAEEAGIATSLPAGGTTVSAEGTRPTVHFEPLLGPTREPVGTLALSRDAGESLKAQREALTALLLTALATTAVVGGLALLLGRRTVEPVRRLTTVARQVSAGDFAARTEVRASDEVGTLADAFDTMTGSLAALTDELQAAAARLQTVQSSMSDGLVASDGLGAVTSINPAALAMVGAGDASEVVGRPLAEVVDVRDATGALLSDPDRLAVAGLRLEDQPADVTRPDGTATPVRVAVTPLASGDGVVLVLRDTTREREVERMKTEFLSNVSHELRTPLTPIRGYADILASRPGLPAEKVTMFAGTILAESLKMNRVVDLLVDVAAIEAGRVTVTPRTVRVQELLDAGLERWRARVPERAGDLKRRVATGLPPVSVDPTWLGKALDELIDNAVKYTPPGTSITLAAAAAPDGRRVRVAVRDTGPGIDVAAQRLLFTSFEQVDGSATRRVGGLGLGLSFVARLAEDAGFPLTVTSAAGKGAEFALDLPPAEDELHDGPAVRPRPRTARRRRTPTAG